MVENVVIAGIEIIIALLVLYLTYRQFQTDRQSKSDDAKERQSEINQDLELKVKELEGRIATEYGELKIKLESLSNTNYAFETRILSNMDKMDAKLEHTQDLILRLLYKPKTNKNENEE